MICGGSKLHVQRDNMYTKQQIYTVTYQTKNYISLHKNMTAINLQSLKNKKCTITLLVLFGPLGGEGQITSTNH